MRGKKNFSSQDSHLKSIGDQMNKGEEKTPYLPTTLMSHLGSFSPKSGLTPWYGYPMSHTAVKQDWVLTCPHEQQERSASASKQSVATPSFFIPIAPCLRCNSPLASVCHITPVIALLRYNTIQHTAEYNRRPDCYNVQCKSDTALADKHTHTGSTTTRHKCGSTEHSLVH